MEGNPVGNISTGSPGKKKTTKIEDEFKKCPHCERKFGPKVRKLSEGATKGGFHI